MTSPSILLFYITKFLFPLHLASQYHWIHPTFSFTKVLLPLNIDIAAFALLVMSAKKVRKTGQKSAFYTYMFYSLWLVIGLLFTLQIFPMDMTAWENWFYFPMAGILGVIGVIVTTLKLPFKVNHNYVIAIMVAVVALLGLRTSLRGLDWLTYTPSPEVTLNTLRMTSTLIT